MPEGARHRRRAGARWLGSAALAAVAGSLPAGGPPTPATAGVTIAARALSYPTRPAFDAPAVLDMREFALNALLAPLIDESVPGRWTDVGLDYFCDPGTRVLVDGQPLVVGSRVPAAPFTVRWDMGRCQPLGAGIELSGRVDLLVTHESGGLRAVVVPHDWRLDSPEGRFRLRGPFTATLSFWVPGHASAERQPPPIRRASTSNGLSR
ncbi:MAG: hypothetical protein Q8K24_05000 [Hydrogenophaga sp.]|nr:hypothetical protein [Hydrogenophaga sp.]